MRQVSSKFLIRVELLEWFLKASVCTLLAVVGTNRDRGRQLKGQPRHP
jgi:hypothetical protein